MTQKELGEWTDKGLKLETAESDQKATYKIEDLVNKTVCITGLRASAIGKYSGNIYTVKHRPDAQIETLYSSSKVLNDQLNRLIDDKKMPCLVVIHKVKNYYSI